MDRLWVALASLSTEDKSIEYSCGWLSRDCGFICEGFIHNNYVVSRSWDSLHPYYQTRNHRKSTWIYNDRVVDWQPDLKCCRDSIALLNIISAILSEYYKRRQGNRFCEETSDGQLNNQGGQLTRRKDKKLRSIVKSLRFDSWGIKS